MISCEEQGMMSAAQPLNWLPFEFEKSIRLSVANESMQNIRGTVRWQVRNANAQVLRSEEEVIEVPALSSRWLEKEMLDDIDIYGEYVSYQLEVDGEIVSEGTVLFSYPKYFRFTDPKLTCEVDGDEIVVRAQSYAKNVEIRNENDDLILSDNFFDMNAGEKRVKVYSGKLEGLKLRSVYDIH
jgi:beta-mannosidase